MICKYCGEIIEEGNLYCGKCGKPIQIVPDYNVLDEEILEIYVEDPKLTKERMASSQTASDPAKETEALNSDQKDGQSNLSSKDINRKKMIRISILAVLILSGFLFSITLYFSSYQHYMSSGNKDYENENYESAIENHLKAYNKRPDSADACLWLGKDYYANDDYENALKYLLISAGLNSENDETFDALIEIYSSENDLNSITALMSNYPLSDSLKEKIMELVSDSVIFSASGGEYTEDLDLKLSTTSEKQIKYTLDGSDPKNSSTAAIFTEPIKISDGTTTVRAVTVSDNTYGIETDNTYTVTYTAPNVPEVTPASGAYSEPEQITIIPEDPKSTIYYTWDGSTPNATSAVYTGPIDMPEGNNVLSVIVVNSHGITSDVFKFNYIYSP